MPLRVFLHYVCVCISQCTIGRFDARCEPGIDYVYPHDIYWPHAALTGRADQAELELTAVRAASGRPGGFAVCDQVKLGFSLQDAGGMQSDRVG